MERGVIAAPGIIRPLPNGFVMERSISAEELRYYLLYWDRVVIPANNLVYIGIPEEDILMETGVISRPKIEFRGSFQGDQVTAAILSCQGIVAKELVQTKTIDWVLHQIGDSLSLLPKFTSQQETIRVSLMNALPVPDGGVPVHEIMDFKYRRKDELGELHDSIDELYFEVLNSPDKGLATSQTVSRLQTAIHNLDAASTEKFKKSRKYDFIAELNINGKDIMTAVALGALIDFYAPGFSFPIAIGAIASLLNIRARATYTFEPAKENTKLAYISNASKENIIIS